jgi:hypothetical protein
MIQKLENNLSLELIKSIDLNHLNYLHRSPLNYPTGRFFHDPWVIKSEFKGTVWDTILSSAPVDIGEARVMRLKAGETYLAHADLDDRYHLSIHGYLDYLIDLENKEIVEVPEDGHFYYMDAGRIHSAINWGSEPRYHLVIRKLLPNVDVEQPISISLNPRNPGEDFRFKFDNLISNQLNRMIKDRLITNVSIKDSNISFTVESCNVSLIKSMISQPSLDIDIGIL